MNSLIPLDCAWAKTKKPLGHLMVVLIFGSILTRPAGADVVAVDSGQLANLIDEDITVIDLRRQDEWDRTGVIEDAHRVTFFDRYGAFDGNKWLAEISAFADPERPVVLICHSGVRSTWVADWLDHSGPFPTVYNAVQGMADWINRDMPVVENQ